MERSKVREFLLVLENWNQIQGPAYMLRPCDLEWNLSQQDLLYYRQESLAGVPLIYAVASAKGVEQGLSEKSLWVSLWGDIKAGEEDAFVQAVWQLAHSQKKARVQFGGDEFHFTPGIPISHGASQAAHGDRLAAAVRKAGFDGAEAFDFVGSVMSAAVDQYVREGLQLGRQHGWRAHVIRSATELDHLSRFMQTEFPGRWAREFEFWRSRKDTNRAFWLILQKDSEEILGFARMAVRSRLQPFDQGWNPCSLRLPLRSSYIRHNKNFSGDEVSPSDSCLGPIGVAKSQRGQGAGRVLLSFVLQTLKDEGGELTCIDWTNAIKYYSPLEFVEARSFWTAWMTDSK